MKRIMIAAIVGLLVSAPVAHCQRVLPPIPDSVETQIGWVPVIRSPLPCNDARALGCFAVIERIIFVRDSMARIMEWKVFLHELGHLRIFDARIRIEDGALEDRVVDMWAMYQLAALLRSLSPIVHHVLPPTP